MSQPKSIYAGQKFKTYDDLLHAIQQYVREQNVPYTVLDSKSTEWFNNRKACEGSTVRIDPSLVWKEATIACKHFGAPRQHEHVPGTKERPNQSTFKKYCPAKFRINYSVKEACFIVTKLIEGHENHPMEEHLRKCYPEFRVPPQKAVNEAEDYFALDVKAHHIRSNVCSYGVSATRQDIQNLRNRWKARLKGNDTAEDAVFQQLDNLLEEDSGGVVAVKYHEDKLEIESIFFQTSQMKASLRNFPELLIMDTTYKLCTNDMPLIVFEVVDCFGKGRIAGYALIASEKKEIVTDALNVMKIGCEEAMEKVTVVMIDRDQSEIAAVSDVLPNAAVHLCDYHVKDAIEKAGRKHQSQNYDEVVHPIVCKMIHAHTKKKYDVAYEQLKKVANNAFMNYFNKRWYTTDLVWSDYQRNLSFNLGERTTGRLESHNGKIKIVVSSKIPVAEVIYRLRFMNSHLDMDDDYKRYLCAAKTQYNKYSKDPVIQQIRKANTPFVADAVERQYQRSLEPPSNNPHLVSINSCDCKFYTNTKLPCSHIFRERSHQGLEVYDHSIIPVRWTVSFNLNSKANDGSTPDILVLDSHCVKAPKRPKTLSAEEQYKECQDICTSICSLVSRTNGQPFRSCINALRSMKKLLQDGREFAVVGLDENQRLKEICYSTTDEANAQSKGNKASQMDEAMTMNINRPFTEPPNSHKTGDQSPETNKGEEVAGADKAVSDTRSNSKLAYKVLAPELRKKLKLPLTVPTKGCPKGNKRPKKYQRKSKKTATTVTAAEENEDSDVDDDLLSDQPCNIRCKSCHGPAIVRTSFTKRNYGRKYLSCGAPVNEQCEKFHTWVEQKAASSAGLLSRAVDKPPTVISTNCPEDRNEGLDVENVLESSDNESIVFLEEIGTVTQVSVKPEQNGLGNKCDDYVSNFLAHDDFDLILGTLPTDDGAQEEASDRRNHTDNPLCPVCQVSGKPKENGGHKCAYCSTPVHSFGCSVRLTSGEEGYGGNDLICIPCSLKGNRSQRTLFQSTAQEAGSQEKRPISFQQTESPALSANGNSPGKEYRCFQCGTIGTRMIGTSAKWEGKPYYACKKCNRFLFWAPSGSSRKQNTNNTFLTSSVAGASSLPQSSLDRFIIGNNRIIGGNADNAKKTGKARLSKTLTDVQSPPSNGFGEAGRLFKSQTDVVSPSNDIDYILIDEEENEEIVISLDSPQGISGVCVARRAGISNILEATLVFSISFHSKGIPLNKARWLPKLFEMLVMV